MTRIEALRVEVQRLKGEGLSQTEIAKRVGKSQARVCQLLRREPSASAAPSTKPAHIARANAASARFWDRQDRDVRLDLALGKPEDLSSYHDCIQGARFEGAKTREAKHAT